MSFILVLVAIILSVILAPIGIIYSIIKLKFRLSSYLRTIAISIDQLGNVIMQDIFNDILISRTGYRFGNEDETISSVLGKNQLTNTLSTFGKCLNKILNYIDTNHSLNSIEEEDNE